MRRKQIDAGLAASAKRRYKAGSGSKRQSELKKGRVGPTGGEPATNVWKTERQRETVSPVKPKGDAREKVGPEEEAKQKGSRLGWRGKQIRSKRRLGKRTKRGGHGNMPQKNTERIGSQKTRL